MSDISNTSDVIDLREVIERVEELREQRTPRFVAGWNMPGYMPDSEPQEFSDAESAKQYIIEEILSRAENTTTESEAETLTGFAEDVNLQGEEFSAQCEGYVYWVREDGVMGLDEEETEELASLEELLSDCQGYGGDHQWEGNWYPVTLIRDSYFQDYAEELADDIGAINKDAGWPNNCIDWERAARELQQDYTSVEYQGVTYWYR